jgi:3-oxoacyl-[acyl-carrier protein] reductase
MSENSGNFPNGSTPAPRCAIVTGGSNGIGESVCLELLGQGYEVISLSREPAKIQSERLHSVRVDLMNAEETRRVAAELAQRFVVTTIVHNAGAVMEKPLEEVLVEDLQKLHNLHVAAPLTLVQANLQSMKAHRYGRIVLVSTRAVLGLAKRTAYSSTKAGQIAMARTWALELGAFGITANVVAPGPIAATRVFHDIIPEDSPKLPRIIEAVPVKRLGLPQDVARAIMFFVSTDAGFITGQTLFVCGGTSVGSITY